MSEKEWIRLAGWAGIATAVCYVLATTLTFAAGPPPDFADSAKLVEHARNSSTVLIASTLLLVIGVTFGLVFVFGIRDIIRRAGEAWASVANLFLVANTVGVAAALAGFGLAIQSASEAATKGDPSATRALLGGGLSVLGAEHLPLILVFVLYAWAVGRTRVLPPRCKRVCWTLIKYPTSTPSEPRRASSTCWHWRPPRY